MSISKRNPLSVIFGAYLKRERNALRESSSRIADRLSLGDSNYRMVEAGSANLNPNRLYLLIKTFSQSRLKYDRLARYLSAVQILEFELSIRSLKDVMVLISDLDEDLEYFLERTKDFFNQEYGTKKHRELLQGKAISELGGFLGDENYRTKKIPEFNKHVVEILLRIPSIELPNILDFLESLHNRQPLHVGPIAKEWEEKNKKEFKTLRGVYLDSGLIIDDDNLQMFQYEYLLEQDFDSLKMLFVNNSSPGPIKDDFIKKLQAVWKKHGKGLLNDKYKKKIEFKTVKASSETIQTLSPLIMGREDVFQKLNAYWSFLHKSGVDIGFVGGEEKLKRNFAINLPYIESLERVKMFDVIWESI